MVDIPTVIASTLLVVTVAVALKYYRILRKARKEYEEAREAVGDVVLSFNRQLKREAEKLETAAFKVEALTSKVEGVSRNLTELKSSLQITELKLTSTLQKRDESSVKLEDINRELQGLITSQSTAATKISNLDEQVKQFLTIPETNIQPVIPIKRDKALAPLTETELAVLEMLTSEGSKTAPQIKDRVNLSREHTARLMKKLYEGGYLERDTGKIPFRYSVKKEMETILRKAESGTA